MDRKQELAALISAKTREMNEILSAENVTEEMCNQAEKMVEEIERYKTEHDRLVKADMLRVRAADYQKWAARGDRILPHADGAQREDADAKSAPEKKNLIPSRVKRVTAFADDDHHTAAEKAYGFGRWAMACILRDARSIDWCKEHGIEIKAHVEGTNESGGFLVPDQYLIDIIDLREQMGVFRRFANVVPMTSDKTIRPRRTGGLTAYFVGEGAAITESTKSWDNVTLIAKKLATLSKISSELNEDAVIDIGNDLAREMAWAFSEKEDQAGFNGDGTSTYGGITGVRQALKDVDPTIANIKGLYVGSGNLYSELTINDFLGVTSLLPAYADTPNVRWFCHRLFYFQVMLKLAVNAGGTPMSEVIAGQRTPMYLGYPVQFTQVMPKVEANSQVCALLGDLRLAAMFGDRRAITIASDMGIGADFANDQVNVKATERIDIVVHDVGDTTDAGPIVGLITAAA